MPQMIWKFVDSPVAVPATLYDMNSWAAGCVVDMDKEFDISPPVLRRTKATNNLTDGSLNTAGSFENRNLVFSVGIGPGTKAQKTALLNNLMSELYKPRNLLMYCPDISRPPVFFRTFRSDDVKIRNRGSGVDEIWGVDCVVEAEPFAVGARIDLAQIVANNDPSAVSGNKVFFDITGIVGDVPTPAFVRLSDMGATSRAILGVRAFGNPTSLTLFQQAESGTLGTNAVISADAAASNGNRVDISFATAGWATRLTLTLPNGSDATALRGRYRVIIRVNALTAALNTSIRWKQSAAGDFVPGPQKIIDLATLTWRYLDLGVIDFPAPQMLPEQTGYSNLATQHATSPLQIEAKRNSGTGSLAIDFIQLIPASERYCSIFQQAALPSGWVVIDGPNDSVYGLASGSTPFSATRILDNKQGIITRQGGLPLLVPGLTNRWYLMHNELANNVTETVDISYWPKWKEVASV